MPTTVEERVAYLEGKVEEHSYTWQDLREAIRETSQRITHMEQKFDQRFIQIEGRINRLEQKFDQRLAQIEGQIIHMEQKFDQRITYMEQKFDQRITHLDQRIDKLFFFILATLVSSLGALISALVSIFAR